MFQGGRAGMPKVQPSTVQFSKAEQHMPTTTTTTKVSRQNSKKGNHPNLISIPIE